MTWFISLQLLQRTENHFHSYFVWFEWVQCGPIEEAPTALSFLTEVNEPRSVLCSGVISPQDGCGPEMGDVLCSIWLNRKVSCSVAYATSAHIRITTSLKEKHILPKPRNLNWRFPPDKCDRSNLNSWKKIKNPPWTITPTCLWRCCCCRSPSRRPGRCGAVWSCWCPRGWAGRPWGWRSGWPGWTQCFPRSSPARAASPCSGRATNAAASLPRPSPCAPRRRPPQPRAPHPGEGQSRRMDWRIYLKTQQWPMSGDRHRCR